MEVLIKSHLGCLVDLYVQGSIVSNISKQCCFFNFTFIKKKKKSRSVAFHAQCLV